MLQKITKGDEYEKIVKIFSALSVATLSVSAISFTVSATNSVNLNKKDENNILYNKMIELLKDKEKLNSLIEDFDEFEIVKSNLKIYKWISELRFYTTGFLEEDIFSLSKINISEKQKLFMLSNLLDKYDFYIKNKIGDIKYSASPEIYKIYPYEASTKQNQEIEINGNKFLTADNIKKRDLNKSNNSNINYEYLKQKGNDVWTINDYKTWDDVTTIEWSTERLLVEWLRLVNDKQKNLINETKIF